VIKACFFDKTLVAFKFCSVVQGIVRKLIGNECEKMNSLWIN